MKRCILALLLSFLALPQLFAAADPSTVIQRYVSKTKGWKASAYEIELKRHEGTYDVYWVIYLHDRKKVPPSTGGGNSFAVYYDPRRDKVIREMHFQ
jgi:hypothetical protein